MRLAVMSLAALLPCCYGSGSRTHVAADTSAPDTHSPDTPADTRPDTPADVPPDAEPVTWRFVDRDVPDRAIRVELLFSFLPDIAWNGSGVGLVYAGMVLGGTNAIGFVPLDAAGNTIGAERLLVEDSGLVAPFPRISSAGDGTFLACFVQEMGDRIVTMRLSPEGDILSRGESPEEMSISDLLSPPVRIGEFAYTATTAYPPGEQAIEIYRFRYPGLEFDASAYIVDPGYGGEDPVLAAEPGGPDLLMFVHDSLGTNAAVLEIDPAILSPTGAITTFGRAGLSAVHGSANSTHWFGYSYRWDPEDLSISFGMFRDTGGEMSISGPADFYNPTIDSDTSDFPSTGGVASYLSERTWYVSVLLEALTPAPATYLSDTLSVNDPIGDRDVDDSMNATIAWTGSGFLVVWDEWRPDATDALFSSYVALEPVY